MEEKYTKIGILSFWWSNDNYGQLLQLFGLYRYVSNQGNGYLPEIICYRPGPQEERKTNYLKHLYKIFNPKKVYKFIKRQILRERLPAQNNSPIREFNDFRENHLKFSKDSFRSFEELAIVEHDYDFIIVGSDQVWNYFPSGKNGFSRIDAYTLHFPFLGENRLSYAASMGFGGLEDIHLSRIVENLNAFKGVSVREESAKTILESQGIKDVEWVPDPSMLLTSDHYLRLVIDDDKYQTDLFVYYVNNSSVLSDQDVSLMLDETDGSYVFVGANNLYNKKLNAYPTVEEWLSYIYHTKMVITNSFHGCVFSILFHKNFYYIPLKQNALGYKDSRIDSLLGRLEIENRSISTIDELKVIIKEPYRPIDWDAVDEKMQEFVQVGKDFLAKHLGGDIQ